MAMTEEEKKYKGWIWTLSIVIPLAVAALFGVNLPKMGYDVEPLSFLPPFPNLILLKFLKSIPPFSQELPLKYSFVYF